MSIHKRKPKPRKDLLALVDFESAPARLRMGVAGLASLVVIGTVGYHLIEPGYTLFDGFYMTVITISTVGFQEVQQLSPAGRLFTSLVIIFGLLTVAFTTGSFIETVIEGGLGRYLGRRALERKIKQLNDHWILCGYGRMGHYVASELEHSKRKPDFLVIEKDRDRLRSLEHDEYLFIEGDATEDEILEEAGIERAAGLVSLVRTDAENVFICLTARQLNPSLTIIARALDENSESKLLRAGANKVIAPYHVGGLRLSQAILRPAVQDFLDFAMGKELEIDMEEIKIKPGSELVGMTLRDSPIRTELDLILVAVRRQDGEMIFNPRSDTQIQAHDILIAVGHTENLHALQRRCA